VALGWQQLFPATEPHFRGQAAMVYDSARQVLVVFGGTHSGTTILGDTWEYDGVNWTQRSPVASPSARYGMGYAYDTANAQTVIFGGITGSNPATTQTQETWVYDGSTWTQKAPAHKPSKRSGMAMGYDEANGYVVLYGGFDNFTPTALSDTWKWTGTDWLVQAPGTVPPKRSNAAITYDPNEGGAVLFGGIDGATFYNTLYLWTGATWSLQAPASPPNGRYDMVWAQASPAVTVVLMFNGAASPSGGSETWRWNGSSWTLQTTPVIPTGQSASQGARFPPNHQTIILAGAPPGGLGDAETWAWGNLESDYKVTFGRGGITPIQDFPNAAGVGNQFNQSALPTVFVPPDGTIEVRITDLAGVPAADDDLADVVLWIDDGG
jgi:hypothetical protein